MRRVLVMPLGEVDRTAVKAAVRRHFAEAELEWFDRGVLRSRPVHALLQLRSRGWDDAVLVATDLRQRRLRLTSLLLALPRARRRWRMELAGSAAQRFAAAEHLRTNVWPIVRHVIACALAAACGEAALRAVAALTTGRAQRTKSRGEHRVLYLRSQLWLGLQGGGSVAHTAGVIGGLEQAGARVHVVSSDALLGVIAPTTIEQPETWFDEPLRELEDIAYNVAFLRRALDVAKHFRPTLIYQRHTAFNCSGAVLATLLKVPLVLEFNSSELWKGQYWGGLRRRRLAGLVERISLLAADRVVVVSNVLRDQLVTQGVASRKIVVNPNAVDPRQFRPDIDGRAIRRKFGIHPDEVVVGFSGTFGLWHGIPTLAASMPLVTRVHWLLIGDGPLRHMVEKPPQANVTLTGLVPHRDMPAYLAACDILVSPHGRQADGGEFFGSPTKLYEYMAMGRPIVASAVGQIAEVLEDGRSALLVPPDDPDALCRAINRLIDCPDLRKRLADEARQAAEQRHTWLQNARRVLACLEQ